MWAKILGIACAGVFIAAAAIEYTQIRRRKRDQQARRDDGGPAPDGEPDPSSGEPGDEPAPATP